MCTWVTLGLVTSHTNVTGQLITAILTILFTVTQPGSVDTLAIITLELVDSVSAVQVWTLVLVTAITTVIFIVTYPVVRDTFARVATENTS